jgi:hypothetical protein
MTVVYNYIYDEKGIAEYVVLPVKIWEILKPYLTSNEIKIKEMNPEELKKTESFNPKDYFGIISHLELDVEQELKNMRSEWTRNF